MALDTHPLSSYAHTILGLALGYSGQLTEGIKLIEKAVEIDPDSYLAHTYLASGYGAIGNFEMAVKTFEVALSMSNRQSWALSFLAAVYAIWGKKDEALEIYNELRSKQGYVQPTLLAMVAASLGYEEEALQFAFAGIKKHDPFLIQSAGNPLCKALWSIPGFTEVQRRMNLID